MCLCRIPCHSESRAAAGESVSPRLPGVLRFFRPLTQRVKHTPATAGLLGNTGFTAMENQRIGNRRPLVAGDLLHQLLFDFLCAGRLRKPQAAADPQYMRIHRDGRLREGVTKHHVGGFSPDPGQYGKRLDVVGDLAVKIRNQLAATVDHRLCLVLVEARRFYCVFKAVQVGLRIGSGRAILPEQCPGNLVDPRVRALRRQNGRNQ